MLRAALRSAWRLNPQARQQNAVWDARLAASVCPQDEQRWLVPLGFTTISSRPASSALYATIEVSAPPGCSQDLSVEPRLLSDLGTGFFQAASGGAGHVGDLEVLEDQQVVGVHQPPGKLVEAIPAAVGNPAVLGGHRLDGLPATVGSPPLASQAPLGGNEGVGASRQVAGDLEELPVRAGRQGGYSENEACVHVCGRD